MLVASDTAAATPGLEKARVRLTDELALVFNTWDRKGP
jgi:hypothetical protein